MTVNREINRGSYQVLLKTGDLPDDVTSNEGKAWLCAQAQEHGLAWMLAFADDGVIWGKVTADGLKTARDAFKRDVPVPSFRAVTLQELRLFGEAAELLLWRDGNRNWQARVLRDGDEHDAWVLDEAHMQWGDSLVDGEGGFTLVSDGLQGLHHAVPLPPEEIGFSHPRSAGGSRPRPLRLGMRHYLTASEDGTVVISQSRLTGLWSEPTREEA